ncbi:MAG: C4-type zinc ribbon domain-containing protein [Proteobacteria bacterium]|nr:C4-type zinc ribbon domain-containing protein [Pseudomonadota bacterium]
MKEQIETLINLQRIDLEQEALRSDVEKRREKVDADTELLEELDHTLFRHRESLADTQKLLSIKQAELQEIRKGHDHAKTKFNAVTNSRDYAAVEREIENFKKMMTQIEGEIEQLQSAITEAEAVIEKHGAEYALLRDEIDANRKSVDEASAAIEGKVRALQAKSDEMAKKINPQILARYRFIRSKRSGMAAVSASLGTCSGCHMKLQPQAFIQLQRQNSLECCQNCQRILYFDAAEVSALHH